MTFEFDFFSKNVWLWSLQRCDAKNFLYIYTNVAELCRKKFSFFLYFELIINNNFKHYLTSFPFTIIRISNDVDSSQRCKLQTYLKTYIIKNHSLIIILYYFIESRPLTIKNNNYVIQLFIHKSPT